VEKGLAASRKRAADLVQSGQVFIGGRCAKKPGQRCKPGCKISVDGEGDFKWVGRGALKMLGALDSFPTVEPTGKVCADFGSSTGGFTEVLLSRGAERIYAVDVGIDQLAERLQRDSRVVSMEGTNVRHLERLPELVDLLVGDLSFISLCKVLPAVCRVLREGGDAILLVKPQFEVGPAGVGSAGLVRSSHLRDEAISNVTADAVEFGFEVLNGADCVISGARAKNEEHFLHLRKRSKTCRSCSVSPYKFAAAAAGVGIPHGPQGLVLGMAFSTIGCARKRQRRRLAS